MSTDPASLSIDAEADGQDWPSFVLPSNSSPGIPLAGTNSNASHSANLSISSPRSPLVAESKRKSTRVANLLALTELRKATWARIYASGLSTGDADITTSRVPTWKQFDAVMIKCHRFIAVDPRDNRTMGWIACFYPYPQLEPFYSEDEAVFDVGLAEEEDVRQGRVVELQVMVAETERGRGVGTFLVKAVPASLETDWRYSTVQASCFPGNEAFRKLLERCEFQSVSTRSEEVKMIDGPRKGDWRDLVTFKFKLPPIPPSKRQEQQPPRPLQQEHPLWTAPVINLTIDPNALFKRPRFG